MQCLHMLTKDSWVKRASANQANIAEQMTNALIHPKICESSVIQELKDDVNSCMGLDACKKAGCLHLIKGPWQEELDFQLLRKHG